MAFSYEHERNYFDKLTSLVLYQQAIDSMMDHIAILDANGWIISVNDAWINFARENGDPSLSATGIGVNYLEVCRNSAETERGGREALYGISSSLEGLLDRFSLEYPCLGGMEKRWFMMSAMPLKSDQGGAIIVHADITSRKQAQLDCERLIAQLNDSMNMLEVLGNLVPVCSRCKRLRQHDENYWENLRIYVASHQEVDFCHGLCADCRQAVYTADLEGK